MTSEAELVTDLVATADRLDGLADTAELMDDAGNAERFRLHAATLRTTAMGLLDERSRPAEEP